MNNNLQNCPICSKTVEYNNIFPNYVCNACAAHATDAEGQTVIFYHTHINNDGYQGYYRRNQELIPFIGNNCYIKGIKCIATYDHFGGIVLQPETEEVIRQNMHKRSLAMSS